MNTFSIENTCQREGHQKVQYQSFGAPRSLFNNRVGGVGFVAGRLPDASFRRRSVDLCASPDGDCFGHGFARAFIASREAYVRGKIAGKFSSKAFAVLPQRGQFDSCSDDEHRKFRSTFNGFRAIIQYLANYSYYISCMNSLYWLKLIYKYICIVERLSLVSDFNVMRNGLFIFYDHRSNDYCVTYCFIIVFSVVHGNVDLSPKHFHINQEPSNLTNKGATYFVFLFLSACIFSIDLAPDGHPGHDASYNGRCGPYDRTPKAEPVAVSARFRPVRGLVSDNDRDRKAQDYAKRQTRSCSGQKGSVLVRHVETLPAPAQVVERSAP